MLHASDPWKFEADDLQGDHLIDANGKWVYLHHRANLERAAACVSAMAGIPACDLPKVRALWDAREAYYAEGPHNFDSLAAMPQQQERPNA